MKINKTFEYTICALSFLSKVNEDEFVTAKKIAQKENLPVCYLSKILKNLTRAGILRSNRGKGYMLKKKLDSINLKELSDTVAQNGSSLFYDTVIYNGLKERVDKMLSEIKLSDILK